MLEEKELLYELIKEKNNQGRSTEKERDVVEIDLVAFLNVIKKRILVILLVAVVGAGIMGAYSFFVAKPMYESTAKMYVLTQSTSVTSLADIQLSSELAMDYTEMIYSYPVIKQVISNLNLDYKYKQVSQMVAVENPSDTRVIKITVTGGDPEETASMTNEFAKVSKQTIADIMETDEPKIFEHGRVPANPVSPNKTKNIALGFMCGGILAILILLVIFVVKDTIKTAEDIQHRLGGNVLATVPREKTVETVGTVKKGGKKQ